MVGTTRSRVTHFLNKSKKLGFINYNGGLTVHSGLISVVLNDQYIVSLNYNRIAGRQCIKLFPAVNDRFDIYFRDALKKAAAEFFPGLHPDVPQERARHLTNERLDDIEPRSVRGRQDVFESVGAGG